VVALAFVPGWLPLETVIISYDMLFSKITVDFLIIKTAKYWLDRAGLGQQYLKESPPKRGRCFLTVLNTDF